MGGIAARVLLAITAMLLGTACGEKPLSPDEGLLQEVQQVLGSIGFSTQNLALPRIGDRKVSEVGRLSIVDSMLAQPLAMIDKTRLLAEISDTLPSVILSKYLVLLEVDTAHLAMPFVTPAEAGSVLERTGNSDQLAGFPSQEGAENDPFIAAARDLIVAAALAREAYRSAGGNPGAGELETIGDHLARMYASVEPASSILRMSLDEYHDVGARIDLGGLAFGLLRLLEAVEQALPALQQAGPNVAPREWATPLGRVRIGSTGDDVHSGEFVLLIDPGGNDRYENVGPGPHGAPGAVTIVIDLGGDDHVRWGQVAGPGPGPGPGAGVLGISVWVDAAGDDWYEGNNVGLGVGLLGAGVLWDKDGNDIYEAGAMVQGAGRYGIGMLIDGSGDDQYKAQLDGQGFGGPGGIGIHLDLSGDDSYNCGGFLPDEVALRIARHESKHYASMCQGYSIGRRLEVSGGVGLLLDRDGDDHYVADLFAQGAAYWFGLGMLVDRAGDDRYEAFEHCQGEGLHLGAGILSDWGGDDHYSAYEHTQGAGIDRAAGILYEHSGNDRYRAHRNSQGAGIKPYGVGLLLELEGDDDYQATERSQGFSIMSSDFPLERWPIGVLLDLAGNDRFHQSGVSAPVTPKGRIQNKQGIAVDR